MLIADIGGTRARFAIADGPGRFGKTCEFPTGERSFEATVGAALEALGESAPPTRAMFAVAGHVRGGKVTLTNAGWEIDARRAALGLGFEDVSVINDFEALAHALGHLKDDGKARIGGGEGTPEAAKLVLGPGTGLGVAAAVPDGKGGWQAVAGEGGHVTLAPRTGEEDAILLRMRTLFPHVSAERVLSGSGLAALHTVRTGEELGAAAIAAAANAGQPTALSTVHVFTDFLATVAGDAALTFGARGGVFLTGGVLTGLGAAFEGERFRARFADKGRFSDYLAAVPVYRITHPMAALLGLSTFA